MLRIGVFRTHIRNHTVGDIRRVDVRADMSVVDLEVLAKSGTPKDRLHAAKILPVVRNQYLLLCTLLICNPGAMEVRTVEVYWSRCLLTYIMCQKRLGSV
ncbi:hypothetical protein I3760_06G163400 [Carya illinoinensis]|nr:hypothetical protein I3760_06G163400 [Carya illinoinensis]KAG2704012.1 hypothetical protein I3760_06G163400 [Carya illinoinensis]